MIKTIDEALGYLLRDPQSVEAEAGRVIGYELKRLREELVLSKPLFSRRQLEAKLERAEALLAKWPADLAMFKAQAHPTWQTDPTALIERATAAFCEELEAALRSVE